MPEEGVAPSKEAQPPLDPRGTLALQNGRRTDHKSFKSYTFTASLPSLE